MPGELRSVRLGPSDLPDCFLDVLIFPQPSCASMTRPRLPIRFITLQTVQTAAGIRLESVHDHLGTNVCFHHCMNVIGSHVRRPQTPATMQTNLAQSTEHGSSAVFIQPIWRLVHACVRAASVGVLPRHVLDWLQLVGFQTDCDAGPPNQFRRRAGVPHSKRRY